MAGTAPTDFDFTTSPDAGPALSRGHPEDTQPRGNAHSFLKNFPRILLKSATRYVMVYKRFDNESGSLAIQINYPRSSRTLRSVCAIASAEFGRRSSTGEASGTRF